MAGPSDRLPSWRPGPTRAALTRFRELIAELRRTASLTGDANEGRADPEPITDVADRLGWTTISMARDWATVFPPI